MVERKVILARTSGKCISCGAPLEDQLEGWDIHHLVPRAYGGPDAAWNLVPICRPCHRRVHEYFSVHTDNCHKERSVMLRRKMWLERVMRAARQVMDDIRKADNKWPVNWAHVRVYDATWCDSLDGEQMITLHVSGASPDAYEFRSKLVLATVSALRREDMVLPVTVKAITEW